MIFCIGAHKTASTSLQSTLENIGFKFPDGNEQYKKFFCTKNHELLGFVAQLRTRYKANAFRDSPFNLFKNYVTIHDYFHEQTRIKPLSQKTKFILTIRDSEKWFDSVVRWIQTKKGDPKVYEQIYGCPVTIENKQRVIQEYESRNREIQNFFKNTNSLLVLDICDGDNKENFTKLCNFLNITLPHPHPHPHPNKVNINANTVSIPWLNRNNNVTLENDITRNTRNKTNKTNTTTVGFY